MITLVRPLVDGTVIVRPFEESDGRKLVVGRDDESRRFLGEGSPDPRPLGVIVVDGDVVGWVDADDERDWLANDEVNLGYGVFPLARGRGYGTRAVLLLSEFLTQLDEPLRPTLLIDPANTPSLALAARAGFVDAGRLDDQLFFRFRYVGSDL